MAGDQAHILPQLTLTPPTPKPDHVEDHKMMLSRSNAVRRPTTKSSGTAMSSNTSGSFLRRFSFEGQAPESTAVGDERKTEHEMQMELMEVPAREKVRVETEASREPKTSKWRDALKRIRSSIKKAAEVAPIRKV